MTIVNIFVLIPIILPFLTVGIIVLVRMLRPQFGYSWLLAAASTLIGFVIMIAIRAKLPLVIPIISWDHQDILTLSPELLFDEVSWAYGLALAGLAVAIIFTDVARADEADWSAWASSLAITALGFLAVFAGNLLTIVLVWAAIDFTELILLLVHVEKSDTRERVIISFSARAGGILLVLLAGIVMQGEGKAGLFINITDREGIYLILACGLRLGILPLHLPFITEPPLRRSLGTALRVVPAATSFVLVTRVGYVHSLPIFQHILLLMLSLAAVYGAYNWVRIKNVLDGRPHWIIGTAALAMASAIRGEPTASLAWGVTSLLAGSLLFLNSAPHRRLQPIIGLGLLSTITLPFLPAWDGSRLYFPANNLLLLALVLAQSLLVTGYIRHAINRGHILDDAEPWVWIVYPIGLLVLPITQVVIAWSGISEPARIYGGDILTRILSGISMLGFVWLWLYTPRSSIRISPIFKFPLRNFFSLDWLYRYLWITFRYFGRGIRNISLVLEGEGGILWALLLLVLILAFLVQV